jgi:hypothetical protein
VRPQRILLFVRSPFDKPIKSVTIDGKSWPQWDNDREAVTLPVQPGTLQVRVAYD